MAYLSRKSFTATQRPFVWASSFSVINERNELVNIPQEVSYRVKNSPATIKFSEVKITLNKKVLFENRDENFVRFPDDASQWGFRIGEEDFSRIMSNEPKGSITREIILEYSALGEKTTYNYSLKQSYNPHEKQWRDIKQSAT